MKAISSILFVMLMYLFQNTISPMLFHGWQPDIFLVWIIVTTVVKGKRAGYKTAFIGGVVQDIVIGNLLGLHAFPYLAVVYIVGRTASAIYEEQWYRSSIAVAGGTFLQVVLQWLLLAFGGFDMHFGMYLWNYALPMIIFNSLLASLVHYVVWSRVERESYSWI